MASYLGEEIKKLGFGLMRLPRTSTGEIDIDLTSRMVDKFLEKGFTYFDTAYIYDNSEDATREALVKRHPRESFFLATKMPLWDGNATVEEVKQRFYTSLERTGAGYFDFYLMHCLGGDNTKLFDEFGIWDFVKDLKKQGLVKHMGFSFHASAEKLEEILIAHPESEFVQLQINYSDWESDDVQSRKCYEVARKYNKPIIIMEPVKGGSLALLPDEAAAAFKRSNPDASTASWAIRYAASLEGVITVLSGMSNMEQMDDNTSYMENFVPLTKEEYKVIDEVKKIMDAVEHVPCTSCRYCIKNCPKNIPINEILGLINFHNRFNNPGHVRWAYGELLKNKDNGKLEDCIKCRKCESICPQHIKITEHLDRVTEIIK